MWKQHSIFCWLFLIGSYCCFIRRKLLKDIVRDIMETSGETDTLGNEGKIKLYYKVVGYTIKKPSDVVSNSSLKFLWNCFQ